MSELILPEGYSPLLDVHKTERAIKKIKDFFELNLSTELNLIRATAPLFVEAGTGINDDLNGAEKPVGFAMKDLDGRRAEIVQSLAKWKRLALADLNVPVGRGIYTDMNAIRPDEGLDNTHSLYVDQWDWERAITAEDRTVNFLETMVRKIYEVLKRTEVYICEEYDCIDPILPEEITFIHTEDLMQRYPDLAPREREHALLRECGAAFILGIGGELSDGSIHDGRAPDYDDWSTKCADGRSGLNGDIFVWNPVLEIGYELSSMGIRVDREALLRQLEIRGCPERKDLYFHKRLLEDELPLSMGGGIGQSRLCMYYLRKAHIGEIQASIWPEEMRKTCKANGIPLL